jgi:signal transduction histidine kinase
MNWKKVVTASRAWAAIRPREVCDAVARIVQEGLVNVRKHSGASRVLVQFDCGDGYWRLTIDDNGRGFPFSGCLSAADLEADRKRSIGNQGIRPVN